ncbi:hypothetical protein MIMGU_mgv1a025229mg [Erythranthe guttata]|uniref:O-fucosyltransferase family protein n=1 Tax=Erythranthe guttata TaxID=4155 RepID=A0A022RTG6_ERYGU|nr:hypothetical protein MIMGU_mgv1a025229mg [Erythranthe guttata]
MIVLTRCYESHIAAAEINTEPNRYLLIAASGGLNQQRTGIVDAVVAAYILKATLVVPKLDQESFWKDPSNFSEIFDVDWFMTFMSKDVKIIKELPQNATKVLSTRVPRKCNPKCYETRVLPIFNKKHAVELTKFDYRLSNLLEDDLQKLRCRVNYHGLRFNDPIRDMGRKLVERMRIKSKHFIALHLRYEPDMLAFSGCYYGGGEKETKELSAIRKRWKTLHTKDPERERRHGKCPLSPEEVGVMLRALGFGEEIHIYVASGEIYGGEEALAPLKSLFPNIHTKESIAIKEELAQFSPYSSRMAALDFIVCDESDVFVTNNNGNMAKILSGRRRYFGHKPTIRPNTKKLQKLFLNRDNTTWEEFSSHVREFQTGFMGEPLTNEVNNTKKGEFHENPWSCICENSERRTSRSSSRSSKEDVDISNDEVLSEYETDLSETEYPDDENGILQGRF